MLDDRNGLAPIHFTALLVEPQLVTPITWFGMGAEPTDVPVSVGWIPKLINHGPPLDPPHIRDPMMALSEYVGSIAPCASLRSMRPALSRQPGYPIWVTCVIFCEAKPALSQPKENHPA